MTSTSTDRLYGLTTSVAVKPPCRAATTANVTLSGLQTIDGVALASGDRVLVKNQTSSVDNGIYVASTSTWQRAKDFDGSLDAVNGTQLLVTSGSTNSGNWRVSATDPVTIQSSAITFSRITQGTATDVPVTPSGNLSSSNVQAALLELQGDINTLNAGGAVAATSVSVTPSGNLASTTAQAAFLEHQGDIDALVAEDVSLQTQINAISVSSGFVTGDIKVSFNGSQSGWVVASGRTIGDASSSATERANADTSTLFAFLWNNFSDSICPVSGGRGANAAADFAAHKRITLLDCRDRSVIGKGDMGGAAAGRVTTTYGWDTTVLGSSGGAESHMLTVNEMPAHTHGVKVTSNPNDNGSFSATLFTGTGSRTTNNVTVSAGGSESHTNMQPGLVAYILIKL